jgi:hypothetical protein
MRERALPHSIHTCVETSAEYKTWEQLAEYFDGDGTVTLMLTTHTVVLNLDWADSFRPQLEAVRHFLIRNGFGPSKAYPLGNGKPLWHVHLCEKGGLLVAMKKMLPHLCKKRDQVQASIDYLENKILGQELVHVFNHATEIGTRSGFIKNISMPYTHEEGVAHGRSVAKCKHSSEILTDKVLDEIMDRRSGGETLREISLVYGTSRTAIRKAFLKRAGHARPTSVDSHAVPSTH